MTDQIRGHVDTARDGDDYTITVHFTIPQPQDRAGLHKALVRRFEQDVRAALEASQSR